MFGKILKFIGLIFLINALPIIPFGSIISTVIVCYALWKMID